MPTSGPLSRDLFDGLDAATIHVRCGSEAPLLRCAAGVLADYGAARAAGQAGRKLLEAAREEARQGIADLLGVRDHAGRIAFTGSTGAALDIIARSIDWRAGDEIVVLEDEFPSVILAWRCLDAQGVTTRLIPGGAAPEVSLIAAVTPRTRLVCVSHVSWRTGLRIDVERLASGLRARGVKLVLDAGHSLGVLPVPAALCDAVVACGHKFLLGLHGTGILYWSDGLRPDGSRAPLGWYSVDGFEVINGAAAIALKPDSSAYEIGNPAFLCLMMLRESLRLLAAAGHAAIADHALGLAAAMRAGLDRRGIPCLTPAEPHRHGTSIAIPDPVGDRLHQALEAAGHRTARGVGRLRISFHGYNTTEDVARVLDVLDILPTA